MSLNFAMHSICEGFCEFFVVIGRLPKYYDKPRGKKVHRQPQLPPTNALGTQLSPREM